MNGVVMNDSIGLERINGRGLGRLSRDNTFADSIRELTGDVFRNLFGDIFRLLGGFFLFGLDDNNFR
jgi:hypothetical protein